MDRVQLDPDESSAMPEPGTTAFSRRQLIHRGAATVGTLAGWGLLAPEAVLAAGNPAPRPIPGGFSKSMMPVPSHPVVHVLPPGIGFEMATITDFHGIVAASETRGTARGSDGTSYDFDADMRFMQGTYVALDGRVRTATFGFI
jgi:hypothetical protein